MLARGKFVTVGTALSTLALTIFTVLPAHADDNPAPDAPPAGSTDTVGAYVDENQNQLMDFKSWIIDRPGLSDSGYIESVNVSSTLSTTLLWSGSENDIQRSIIAEGARRGITVSVEYRKFSGAQLTAAAAKITSAGSNTLSGFQWTAVDTITADFDGIIVKGTFKPSTAAGKSALGTEAVTSNTAAIAKKAADLGGVDVKVESGASSETATTHRWDDTPAFNAGGLLYDSAGQSYCTTGFSVKVGGTPYTTTARHCIAHDYRTLSGGHSYGDGVRNSSDGTHQY